MAARTAVRDQGRGDVLLLQAVQQQQHSQASPRMGSHLVPQRLQVEFSSQGQQVLQGALEDSLQLYAVYGGACTNMR